MLGLALAPIYPCLMTRTPQRIGSGMAAHAIGFQVSAAMLGAAALPATTGLAINRFGLELVATISLALALSLFVLHEALLFRDRHLTS